MRLKHLSEFVPEFGKTKSEQIYEVIYLEFPHFDRAYTRLYVYF